MIFLIDHYALSAYRLCLLEVQKLMYFLQEAGEPLRLAYEKKQYGPYAENLNLVLQRLEGHYIAGYGDRSGNRASIHLKSGAAQAAQAFLKSHWETLSRLKRVTDLIEGFETPYGMELLATVHWLAQEIPAIQRDYSAAVKGFEAWNPRKREHFRPEHIRIAWERLRDQGWISSSEIITHNPGEHHART